MKKLSSSIFTLYLIIFLINVPKINLISVGGFSQGIRAEDILILIIFLLFFRKLKISSFTLIVSTFVFISVVVGSINNSYNFALKLLYFVRLIEYLIVFELLRKYLDGTQCIQIAKVTFFFQLFMCLMQFFVTATDARVFGTTAGPWEVTIVVSICYFIIRNSRAEIKIDVLYFILLLVVIVIAAGRAQLAGLFVALLLDKRTCLPIKYFLITSFISLSIFIYLYSFFPSFGYLAIGKFITTISEYGSYFLYELKSGDLDFGEGGHAFGDCETFDCSLIARLQQWAAYIKAGALADNKLIAYLYGNGPGSGGIILDGWYIKLFVDFGIFGIFIYFFYIIKYFRKSETKALIIFLSICGLTLDLYWASKVGYALCLAGASFSVPNIIKKSSAVSLKGKF